MVLGQGKEKREGRDLCCIGRAMFAMHVEEHGFDRNVVVAALSVDKSEAVKLFGVARSVPAAVVLAIGPAPRIGRPRWMALSKLMEQSGNEKRFQGIIATDSFKTLSSDRRFEALFTSLSAPKDSVLSNEHWSAPNVRRVVTIQKRPSRTTFIFNENLGSLDPQFKSRGGE